jgi:hypothetical protein
MDMRKPDAQKMNSNIGAVQSSSQLSAGTGGILYGVLVLAAMFAVMFLKTKLIVVGDGIGTADNIMQALFLAF